ncbi:SDR family NAD(P)-dependent oxidoreductase [Streptomyces albus]|uniref:SDR family NAD(P)-dependent oxidoreductase n=1 Tax=Streptomyces albus TaxID=1888 RepID=UPI003F1DAC7E
MEHPFLAGAVELPAEGGVLLSGRISPSTDPWLEGHAVSGAVLLPGTGFLELAAAAARHTGCGQVDDLVVRTPLVLPAGGADVQVQVAAAQGGERRCVIRARSDGHKWVEHATATLVEQAGGEHDTEWAAGTWPPPGAESVPVPGLYEELATRGYGYGPAFHGLRGVWRSDGDLFAEAVLPERYQDGRFGVHPALLDAALHPLALTHDAEGKIRLPFVFGRTVLRGRGARALRVRLRVTDGSARLDAVSDSGQQVLSCTGLVLRPVDTGRTAAMAASSALNRLRYEAVWQPVPDVPRTERAPGTWLVLAFPSADPSWAAPPVEHAVTVPLDRAAGRAGLTASLPDTAPDGVLCLTRRPEDLLLAVQALDDARVEAPVWCVTHRAEDDPDAAAVWGAGRAVALELPERWGGLVDVPERRTEPAAALLAGVLSGNTGEDQVRVRDDGVEARRLVRADPPPDAGPARWTPSGTVLITGGTGALGAHVARWVAGLGGCSLLLVSRRGPQAPGARELAAELTAAGTPARVVAADVTDRAAMAGLVAEAARDGAPVRAVFHTAGVPGRRRVLETGPEDLRTVLAAKAEGARVLDAVLEGTDVDAFVLFSSVSGVWGAAGQAAYGAANAALDALAARRRARGRAAVSLAWGPWSGGGMVDAGLERDLRRRGLVPLAVADAMRALEECVPSGADRVLVDAVWSRFLPLFTAARPAPLFAHLTARLRETAPEPAPSRDTTAPAGRTGDLLHLVRAEIASVVGHADAGAVDPERPLRELGFDSLMSVRLRDRLAAALGVRLSPTVAFDHPTSAALARHLETLTGTGPAAGAQRPAAPAGTTDEPVAVVGMACRYPGGIATPEDLWRLVRAGRDAIGAFPADRGWDLARLHHPDRHRTGTTYTREGGFLDDPAGFDAGFFGIPPREALAMDPQQRLMLETAWEAVEHAGIGPESLRGSRTGVFAGTMYNDYYSRLNGIPDGLEGILGLANSDSVMSGRISYLLGLEGPAVTVDTACSSSLVAVHLACQALRQGECDAALAGGATVMATPNLFVEFARQGGLAADGRCKSFSADADGTGWSEGVGVVLLERLSDARRLGHEVLAVVRGSAVNQDGASHGLTAPNGPAQQRVIRAALARAGVTGADVDAVEAHGTGTKLGDPIEAQALLTVYGERRGGGPLYLGSLKSNLGHAQAAAGVGGLIKTVQALRHEVLPPTLHAQTPTPAVDWSAGGVALLTEERAWPRGERRRLAGVSSFGISGTNTHVVLEEGDPLAPLTPPPSAPSTTVLAPGQVPGPRTARAPDDGRAQGDEPAPDGGRDRENESAPGGGRAPGGGPTPDDPEPPDNGHARQHEPAPDSGRAPDSKPTPDGPEPPDNGHARQHEPAPDSGRAPGGEPGPYSKPTPVGTEALETEQAPEHGPEPDRGPEPGVEAGAVPFGERLPFVLGARTAAALPAQARALRARLEAEPGLAARDVAWSLATTRSALAHRAVAVAGNRAELLDALTALGRGTDTVLPASVRVGQAREGRTVLMFPGQGSQWRGMGRALLAGSEVFAEGVRECEEALAPWVDWSLTRVLRGADGAATAPVDVVQPALFAVMVSLARMWQHWGVPVDGVVGHSQGEIAAACVSGALSLADGARVVAVRSRLLAELAGTGGMVSVALPPEEVRGRLGGRLSLASVNGPGSVVVSGPDDALEELMASARADGVPVRRIDVDYASHSPAVEALRDRLRAELSGLSPREGTVPLYSTVTGTRLTGSELDAAYWYRNLRETVRLRSAVESLAADGFAFFAECSPHPVLTVGVRETLDALGAGGTVLGSLRRDEGGTDRMLRSLAEGYADGLPVDWRRVLGAGRRVPLPTYAFQHERFWLDAGAGTAPEAAAPGDDTRFWEAVERGDVGRLAGELGTADGLAAALPALAAWRRRSRRQARLDSWRYDIVWRPHPVEGGAVPSGRWLLLTTGTPAAEGLRGLLADGGLDATVLTLGPGTTDRTALGARLAEAVDGAGGTPFAGVLSLLGLDETPHPSLPGLTTGLALTIAAVQALGDTGTDAPLWTVTCGASGVGELGPARPAQNQLWGLGRVAALEHPARWGGLVDLPAAPGASGAAALLGVLARGGGEDQWAVSASGTAHVRRLVRRGTGTAPAGDDDAWRPAGTVLITGASGSLGPHLARSVAARGARHVALLSRRGESSPGTAELVAELAEAGCTAQAFACDVRDRARLAAVLAELSAAGRPVTTALHAAAHLDIAPLATTTLSHFAEVVDAKVSGAVNLVELLEREQLREVVLFSSIAGVWGSAEHGAYAAANAFLDAYAARCRADGLPVTSVAWGIWDEQITRDRTDADLVVRRGLPFLDRETAFEGLYQALAAREAVQVVADVDWSRFVPVFTSVRDSPLLAEIAGPSTPGGDGDGDRDGPGSPGAPAEGAAGAFRARLAAMTPADREHAVLELVRSTGAVVLGRDAEDRLGPDQEFRQAGFDSLLSVDLRNRLNRATGLRLPPTLLFDHATPARLAQHLLGHLADGDAGAEGTPEDVLAGLDRIERQIRALPGDGTARLRLTARVETLLAAVRGAGGDDAGDGGDAVSAVESAASTEELLDLLDSRYGES